MLMNFLDSAFVSAFLSALAGAGFGVFGAQKLAERAARKKELAAAIRQGNALIVLSAMVTNQTLSLRKQNVVPIYSKYLADRAYAAPFNEVLLRGERPAEPISFSAQLVSISPITIPIEAIKNLAYTGELMPGKALALVVMLDHTYTELSRTLDTRNNQIAGFKAHQLPQQIYWQNYFGFRRLDGNTDSVFHDALVGLDTYSKDLAFFGAELAEEIVSHVALLREKLSKLSKDVPQRSSVDFSAARNAGLLPPREEYADWLAGFQSASR
jgi:hypothetical protein